MYKSLKILIFDYIICHEYNLYQIYCHLNLYLPPRSLIIICTIITKAFPIAELSRYVFATSYDNRQKWITTQYLSRPDAEEEAA